MLSITICVLFQIFHVTLSATLICPSGLEKISVQYNGVVCQDLEQWVGATNDTLDGRLVLITSQYQLTLPIHLEAQALQENKAYYNFTKQQILMAQEDLLGNYVLGQLKDGEDPSYRMVRQGVPPIQNIASTFTFTGSRFASVDISFGPNGEDTAFLGFPTPDMFINVKDYQKYGGLIGGYLPIVVFMFTKPGEAWEFDYVPLPAATWPGQREQRLFFRAVHITKSPGATNVSIKVMFNDTYAYLGNYRDSAHYEQGFYDTIKEQSSFWKDTFQSEKTVSFPHLPTTSSDVNGAYLMNQALHCIVKDMVTRRDFYFPSYGVYPGYGVPGNNGFQEILTVSLPVALEWGLFEYARGILKNYLDYYWLQSGNVMYRGLEMAESARMLTQVAMYYRYTGDITFFSDNYLDSINGTVNMFLERYERALKDPQHGIATGNDEADLWETTVRGGFTEYPFYSISAEMSRAFQDLGGALYEVGPRDWDQSMTALGKRMLAIAPQMLQDLRTSLAKARRLVTEKDKQNMYCLPYVAGQRVCDNVPGAASIRVSEPWRTYSEMMYSGVLSVQNVEDIVNYSRSFNASMKLGMLSGTGGDCCGDQLMTFTSHGFAWGLLQNNKVAEFLLMFFTASNHAMSRGHWTAPESSSIDRSQSSVAYCSPSQGLVPLMLKWMLVFEDYTTGTLWIGKAIPREWMKENQDHISFDNATASYGSVSFKYKSEFTSKNIITVSIAQHLKVFPRSGIMLSVRAPIKKPWSKVTCNGEYHTAYNATMEYIKVPASNITQIFTVSF